MEYSSTTRSVVVPRCETCNGKFKPKEKVYCVDCNAKIHYDCAVYDDEDERYMLCIDCFKNKKIEKGLERNGILMRVKGNDLCRAYIGKSFWEQEEEEIGSKIKIEGSCEHELECEIIDDDDTKCKFCGWRSEYEQSHIDYGNFKCKYITDRFYLTLDDEGDLVSRVKCAFGYCEEDLYNRGCLPDWEKMWICEECKSTNNPRICGKHLGDGEYCDEKASPYYEYCKECMEEELGMN